MTSLTPRQLQILSLLAAGLYRKEIAFKLRISHRTIDTHMSALFRMAEAGTVAQLIFHAIKLGWLSVKGPPRCKACGQLLPSTNNHQPQPITEKKGYQPVWLMKNSDSRATG